jgi:hypothetical protein
MWLATNDSSNVSIEPHFLEVSCTLLTTIVSNAQHVIAAQHSSSQDMLAGAYQGSECKLPQTETDR